MSWLSDQWDGLTKKWNHYKAEVKGYLYGKAADVAVPGSGDTVRDNILAREDPENPNYNPNDPNKADPNNPGGFLGMIIMLLKVLAALFTGNFAGVGSAISDFMAAGKTPPTTQATTTDPNHPNPNPAAPNPNPQVRHPADPNHPAETATPPNPVVASTAHGPQVRTRAPLNSRIESPAPAVVPASYSPGHGGSLEAYVNRDNQGRPVDNKGHPVDIQDLAHPFSQKLSLVFDDLKRAGYKDFKINEAVRTHGEQQYLYAHRNDPGRIHVVAVPGTSDHEMGADGRGHAVDIAYNGPDADGFYRKLHQFAAQRGLGPEVRGDRVHLQDKATNGSLMASNRRYDTDTPSA